ncbi:hypothetical protein [Roseovarius sp. SYSU LYC5161]|uniref:hypothetical protein n=1 Tax=Roseovarius halophilus (ex Wu et al. 2025) TaxID=3376060 RepID=UPI00399C400E
MDTLTAEIDSSPLRPSEIAREVTIIEATVGYVREVPDGVRDAVLLRWGEAFAGIPGDVARRAFRSWDRGDRMPNPVELAKIARRIEGKMRHAVRCKAEPRPPAVDPEPAPERERVTREQAAAIIAETGLDLSRRAPETRREATASRRGPARPETLASKIATEARDAARSGREGDE